MDRQQMLTAAARETFDLLVVGGGITGMGIAREAALRGLRAAVVERADFAYGTSSRSTRLIHGGLRYLRNFEFKLVRESVVERQRLIRMAPHLVHPVPFVFPVYAGDPDPLWQLKAGLLLYDFFAGRSNLIPHRMHGPAGLREHEPALRADDLRGGAIYGDCVTDDGRLVLEVLISAAGHGAVAANYAEAAGLLKDGQGRVAGARVRDRLSGDELDIRAGVVLNAAGPWADRVRRLDDPAARPVLRLTKGVHVAVSQNRLPLGHPVAMRGTDGRLMFAVPSGAYTYLGTTDTDHGGEPEAARVEAADVAYILAAAQRCFPDAGLGPADVIGTWEGLRPLLASAAADPSAATRDYEVFTSRSGLVTIGGGKLTAFRAMASHIVDQVFPRTRGSRNPEASMAPLPGAPGEAPDAAELGALAAEVGEPIAEVRRAADRYGKAFHLVLAHYRGRPAGADPRLAWQQAQVRHAVQAEMAVRLEDVLRRRTSMMLFSPDNGMTYVAELAQAMAGLLGWSGQRTADEAARCRELARQMHAWREAADGARG